jgi:hypothetical protein
MERIKNSDMNESDKAKLYQRIRNFLNSDHDDSEYPSFEKTTETGEEVISPIAGKEVIPSIANDYFYDDYFEVKEDYYGAGIGTSKVDKDSVRSFSFSFGKK